MSDQTEDRTGQGPRPACCAITKPTVVTMSVAAVLAACSPTTVVTHVTRRHSLSGGWRDRSFTVVPDLDYGGLEFSLLAATVSGQLQRHGLNPALGTMPDMVATLRYGARTLMMQDTAHASRAPADFDTPVYARWAEILLHEALRPTAVLFHGHAVSEGTSHNLAEVLPHVITGLLRDFPGAPEETLTFSLPVQARQTLTSPSSRRK